MREKLATEVRDLAVESADAHLRTHGPQVARTEAQKIARTEAQKIVDDHIRKLPDPAAVAKSVIRDSVHTAAVVRRIAHDEAEKLLRDLPRMKDVDARIRHSPDVQRFAREEARKIAAAEVQQLFHAEYRTIVHDMVQEIAKESVEDVVRGHAQREIAGGALPRLVEVSVNGSAPRNVDGDTHQVLPDLLLALGAACHVLLVGPAGTGKSTMAKQAAQALDLTFHAMSVGPTTPTSKMFGYLDAHGTYHRTPLREAYERGGLMLLDELDNGHPGLLAELNQALSLDVCAFPDGMIERHERFRLVATANTYGHGGERQYVGRQALDAATLDRLLVVDVPVDDEMERRVTLAHAPTAEKEALAFLTEVRRLRRAAADKKLPVIFSPRASIHAARLLEIGAEPDKVREWCLVRGLSEAHRTALGIKAAA